MMNTSGIIPWLGMGLREIARAFGVGCGAGFRNQPLVKQMAQNAPYSADRKAQTVAALQDDSDFCLCHRWNFHGEFAEQTQFRAHPGAVCSAFLGIWRAA